MELNTLELETLELDTVEKDTVEPDTIELDTVELETGDSCMQSAAVRQPVCHAATDAYWTDIIT